ncbi:MAG: class I SAM-dependent methyltransferase [Gammaproteobacteria bacterium]|nr:class I SAM-dependent methyltransferase [Gammaproteobacteria bacterium]
MIEKKQEQLTLKQYTESNKAAWNEVMPLHQKAAKERWDNAFIQPGFICLEKHELDLITRIGIQEKSIAHLCCNNGIELLSIKNLGAGECVGFDISELAIQEARERAKRSGIDCQYVQSDVYDIGPEYTARFDMVYFSAGGLGWLPNLKLLFAKVARMLRRDGALCIHEIHPFSEMLPFDNYEGDDVLRVIEPYFMAEPYVEYAGLDYVGGTEYDSTIPQYWFVHTLSDIQMAMIQNQIALEYFAEYETDISAGHQRIEQAKAGIPLSYALLGRKGDTR